MRRLFGGLEEVKRALVIDPKLLKTEEVVYSVGEIHGTGNDFIRLQSAFRGLERENTLLKDRYVKWQKEFPNAQMVADKERIIENLTKQIATLSLDLSKSKQ